MEALRLPGIALNGSALCGKPILSDAAIHVLRVFVRLRKPAVLFLPGVHLLSTEDARKGADELLLEGAGFFFQTLARGAGCVSLVLPIPINY